MLGEHYRYLDEAGAAKYLTTTLVHEYRALAERKALIESRHPDILRLVRTYFEDQSKPATDSRQLDPTVAGLIALGAGGHGRELGLLRSLLGLYAPGTPSRGSTEFVPFDVSLPLLRHELQTLWNDSALKEHLDAGRLTVHPTLANIAQMVPSGLGTRRLKVVSALGVLSTGDAQARLRAWREAMDRAIAGRDVPVLLLDVEFLAGREPGALARSYLTPENRDLLWHPLELLGRAAADPSACFYDRQNRPKRFADFFGGFGAGEGSIEAHAVTGKSTDQSMTAAGLIGKFELDPNAAGRYLLAGGALQRSVSVAVVFVPRGWQAGKAAWPRPILLDSSTWFDRDEFEALLRRSGLRVIASPGSDSNGGRFFEKVNAPEFGYYLLRAASEDERATVGSEAQQDHYRSITQTARDRGLTVDTEVRMNDYQFDYALEGKASLWRAAPVVVIRVLEGFDSVVGLEKAVSSLRDDASSIQKIHNVVGTLAWVDKEFPDVLLRGLSKKYGLDIVRSGAELEAALDRLHL